MFGPKGSAPRLTGLDTAFLGLENQYSQMHTLKFGVFEAGYPGKSLNAEATWELLRSHLDEMPCYTQKLMRVPFGPVLEVAVLGVPDEEYGQRLTAFVVLDSDSDQQAMSEELRDMVRDNHARYKVPRTTEVIDELPRNAAGKVVKREPLNKVAEG